MIICRCERSIQPVVYIKQTLSRTFLSFKVLTKLTANLDATREHEPFLRHQDWIRSTGRCKSEFFFQLLPEHWLRSAKKAAVVAKVVNLMSCTPQILAQSKNTYVIRYMTFTTLHDEQQFYNLVVISIYDINKGILLNIIYTPQKYTVSD